MKVEPIINMKDIKSIKKLLVDQPRNRLLFVMGINSGLRVQDILSLKVSDVKDCKIGDRVCLKEKKTGKENVFIMNKEIKTALDEHLATSELEDHHFLFKSRKGQELSADHLRRDHDGATVVRRDQPVQANYGAHTLRKTWCYHQRKTFGVSWEILAKRLNHSTPFDNEAVHRSPMEEVEEILLHTI